MISSIHLKNFRKHTDLQVNLTPGLNVISSPNEAGKTTLVEAIAYAFFGAKGLAEPLDGVVTYDQPASSLNVELILILENKYRITRAKKGAEIYLNDETNPTVTGQREVTAYIEELFGLPTGKANLLMIAEQGDIRGILAEGSAAATSFIEKLAEFNDIDDVIMAIQNKLPVGPVTAEKLQIDEYQIEKTEVSEEVAEKTKELHSLIGDGEVMFDLQTKRERTASQVKELTEEIIALVATNTANAATQDLYDTTVRNLSSVQLELQNLHKPTTVEDVDPQKLTKAEDKVSSLREELLTQGTYQEYLDLPTLEDVWEGDMASLQAEISKAAANVKEVRDKLTRKSSDIKVLKSRITDVTAICPTCGQDVPDATKMIAANDKIKREVQSANTDKQLLTIELVKQEEYLQTLEEVETVGITYEEFHLLGLTSSKSNTVPLSLNWLGHTDFARIQKDYDDAVHELGKIELSISAKLKYDNGVEAYCKNKLSLETQIHNHTEVLAGIKLVPAVEVEQKKSELVHLTTVLEKTKVLIFERENLVSSKEAAIHHLNVRLESLNNNIAKIEKAMKTKEKANTLLKDVKKARLEICASVWNKVLVTVSSYFSKMRGEESQVTKTLKGFEVNGRSAAGLSGSTKDILGLAFRIAQSDIFLAGLCTLMLDEPGSGADQDRSSMMMSLIKETVGQQSLVITHRDTDLNFADNLIEL